MELLFLGTSSGTPTTSRNVSGLALRSAESRQWHLVDCGEGTQHRLLATPLSLINLGAIFITHVHGDHCYGLPGLLASAGMLNRKEALVIAGPAPVKRFVQAVMETTQLRLPYPLQFIDVEATPTVESLPDVDVRATLLSHRVPSFAFTFVEKSVENRLDVVKLSRDRIAQGPLWGEIQQGINVTLGDGRTVIARNYLLPPRKPRKIIVGGDNDTPELLAFEAQDADLLIHEATYTEDILQKVGPGPQHSSARRVAQFATAARLKNLILTHFSPRYHDRMDKGLSLTEIEAEARSVYDGTLFLANDLERYVLDKSGSVSRAR